MKLPLLTMLVLLFRPATAAHYSRRHRRTLSAATKLSSALPRNLSPSTKKPANVAGLRFLPTLLVSTHPLFCFRRRPARTSPPLHSIIQTLTNP
jgi:hypothetical protein